MPRSPLLLQILAALGITSISGCATYEDVQCTPLDAQDQCPTTEEAEDLLKEPDACGDRVINVLDEGEISGSVCCFAVEVLDAAPDCMIMEGRPLMGEAGPILADVTDRADWSDACAPAPLPPEVAAALAASWAEAAQAEHASIAAFAQLTLDLLALGAPPDLLLAVQAAAADEVRHARRCFTLASRYAGRPLGPAALAVQRARHARTLTDLAVQTAQEGCIGETISAALAAAALDAATDPAAVACLKLLTADERRHAALSWQILAWALDGGGPETRAAVEAVFASPKVAIRVSAPDQPVYRAHGRPGPGTTQAVAAQALREVVRPAARALLQRTAPERLAA